MCKSSYFGYFSDVTTRLAVGVTILINAQQKQGKNKERTEKLSHFADVI